MTPAAQLPGFLASIAPLLHHYGYLAVGGLVFVEDFGVPVPGETVLIAAAVEAGAGGLNVVVVAVVAFLAAVVGDNVGYAIGRIGGRALLQRWQRPLRLTPSRLERLERFVAGRGGWIVIVARFIEGLRQVNGLLAGITAMGWRRFVALNAAGAALWVAVWVSLGAAAGSHLDAIYRVVGRAGVYAVVVLALAAVVAVVLVRRSRARRLIPAGAPPNRPGCDRSQGDDPSWKP